MLIAGSTVRILIDTNVLIAALTNRGGSSARIVRAWRDGRVEVVASEITLREAELVLGGGWLARMTSQEAVSDLLEDLRSRTVWVAQAEEIPHLPLKDEGDRRLVEAAVAGGAAYIVTTDREFLSHRGYRNVEFITPEDFRRIAGEA